MRIWKMLGLTMMAISAILEMAFSTAASVPTLDRLRSWSAEIAVDLKLTALQAVRRTVPVSKALALQLALKARNLALGTTRRPTNPVRLQFIQSTRKSNDHLWNPNGNERRLTPCPV